MKKIKPIISEKTVTLAKGGLFTVEISLELTKQQVIHLVKGIFNLNPVDVKIVKRKAHTTKKMRGISKRKMVKKAYVQLEKNERFPGFEIAFEDEKSKKKTTKGEDVK